MLRAVADTHAVIWYIFGDQRLSNRARSFIEATAKAGDQIGVSSITLIEIVYLAEKGRIPTATLVRIFDELDAMDAVLIETPLDRRIADVMQQVDREAIPDMPDRIIAATANYLGVPLISRDGKILISGAQTIW